MKSHFQTPLVTVARLFFAILAVACLTGCRMDNKIPSTNLEELRSLIQIGNMASGAKYEIISLPESDNGVPSPTEYVVMIAELETPKPISSRPVTPASGQLGLIPRAARPWLSEDFRAMLKKYENNEFNFATQGCQEYSTVWVNDNSPVHGFSCNRDGRTLIYLVLQDSQ